MSYKNDTRMFDTITNQSNKCKCGHTVQFLKSDRVICSWCHHWAYKNKEVEFKYKLQEQMNRRKYE
jgi:hypothetical protein